MPNRHKAASLSPIAYDEEVRHRTPDIITPAQKLDTKKKARAELLAHYRWPVSVRKPIVMVIGHTSLAKTLREAIAVLPVHLVMEEPDMPDCTPYDIVVFATESAAEARQASELVALGTIPVVAEAFVVDEALTDYDPTTEQGNAFLATDTRSWAIFAALVRAVETYRLSYDWSGIVRNAIKNADNGDEDEE